MQTRSGVVLAVVGPPLTPPPLAHEICQGKVPVPPKH